MAYKNITKSPAPKLSVRFDKDTLTEAQFYALANFMVQNEPEENIYWLTRNNTLRYWAMSVEHAWYSDSVYGLQILP